MSTLYQITQNSSNSYEFTTFSNTVYEVYFRDGSGYFPHNHQIASFVFMFGFHVKSNDSLPLASKRKEQDIAIRETIAQIIIRFFENNPLGILMYVCSHFESKQIYRKTLFDKWFKQINNQNLELKKVDDYVDDIDGNVTYYSILFRKNRIQQKELIDSFLKIKSADLDDKLD